MPSSNDGDGLYDCECFNYEVNAANTPLLPKDAIQKKWGNMVFIPLNKELSGAVYATHGLDCDDTNPAIGKNSQKCIGENKVATCVSGKWELKDCRKCVTQPNGTGLVVEW
jgi:hypothetical protein